METKSRDYMQPIRVDALFVDRMHEIASDFAEKMLDPLSASLGVSLEQLQSVKDGKTPDGIPDYRIDTLRAEIEAYATPHYTVSFEDGSAIDTTNFQETRANLVTRSAQPKAIDVSVGRYSITKLQFNVSARYSSSAQATIVGSRSDVTHWEAILNDLVANAEPRFRFLYHRHFAFLLLILVAVLLIAVHVSMLSIVGVPKSGPLRELITASLPVVVVLFLALALYIATQFEKTFPKTQFDFGRGGRRRSSAQTLLVQFTGVIAIPVILGLAPALFK